MQKLLHIKRSLLIFTLIFTTSEFIQDKRIKRSQQTMERRIQVFLTEKIREPTPPTKPKKKAKKKQVTIECLGRVVVVEDLYHAKRIIIVKALQGKIILLQTPGQTINHTYW